VLQAGRVGLGDFALHPQRRPLERFDGPRAVDVDHGVELFGELRLEVVALTLRLRFVDDTDRPLEERTAARLIESTAGCTQTAPSDPEAAAAGVAFDRLAAMAERIGLDYFTVDCAENKRGELLIFEADNTAVVHNMDSPQVFPYKPVQMRAVFEAFAAMLYRRARDNRESAA